MSEYDIDLALHSASDGSQFDMFLPRIFDAAGDAADPATLCRCPLLASPASMSTAPNPSPFPHDTFALAPSHRTVELRSSRSDADARWSNLNTQRGPSTTPPSPRESMPPPSNAQRQPEVARELSTLRAPRQDWKQRTSVHQSERCSLRSGCTDD